MEITPLQTSHNLATVYVLAGWGEIISVEGYEFTGLAKDYKCVF